MEIWWWCGRVVKAHCFEYCEVYFHWFKSNHWDQKPPVNSVVHSVVGSVIRNNSGGHKHWTHVDNSLSKVEGLHPV